MRIDAKETILDVPILEVRKLLRTGRDHFWHVNFAISTLNVSVEKAEALLAELEKKGLIEPSVRDGEKYWHNSMAGNAFAIAKASKPLLRKSAEKVFADFMKRVEQVRDDPYYLYKVKKVLLFGSYLSNSAYLNDIDIAIELTPKETDAKRHGILLEERQKLLAEGGMHFNTYVDYLYAPETEVRKFLKSRSRAISLHSTLDRILQTANYRIVYEDDSRM